LSVLLCMVCIAPCIWHESFRTKRACFKLCRACIANSQQAYEMGCADARAKASASRQRSIQEQVDSATSPLHSKIARVTQVKPPATHSPVPKLGRRL